MRERMKRVTADHRSRIRIDVRQFRSAVGVLIGVLMCAPAHPALADAGPKELLARVERAYGGAAALGRVRAFEQLGTVRSTARGGATGALVRAFARPQRLRSEIEYGDATEVRLLDGARGWRDGRPAEGPPLVAMKLQAARLDLPWRLLDPARVRDGGRQGSLHALEVALEGGLVLVALVDEKSGLIVRSVARDPATGLEFVTEYGEHRKVDGVLFAFQERTWAMGRPTGETRLERVEIVPSLPEARFRP